MPITNPNTGIRHRTITHPAPELEDTRASKRPWTEIKAEATLEDKLARTPKPPLTSFFGGPSEQFHTTVGMDLSREYVDLTSSNSAATSRIPVSLIPQVDITAMSRLPIIQDPTDPTKKHPSLPQPAQINQRVNIISDGATADILNRAKKHMDSMLKNPEGRQSYEKDYFDLVKIKPVHLSKTEKTFTPNHPTLGQGGRMARGG